MEHTEPQRSVWVFILLPTQNYSENLTAGERILYNVKAT
uniref:Uncharacterized protein n=1 Tax=Arundo donax TaxID=35708 RepID=A0A0A9BYL9_ARUDO